MHRTALCENVCTDRSLIVFPMSVALKQVDQECATGRGSRWDWKGLVFGFRADIAYGRSDGKRAWSWGHSGVCCLVCGFISTGHQRNKPHSCSTIKQWSFSRFLCAQIHKHTHTHLLREFQTSSWCQSGIPPPSLKWFPCHQQQEVRVSWVTA